MNNLDKFISSKLYVFFDWIWKLIILNLLTIITSLFIVTILPSLTACLLSIKEYKEGGEKNVWKMYFSHFKNSWKQPFFAGLLSLFALGIFGYAIFFYMYVLDFAGEELSFMGIIYYIGLYTIYICVIIALLIWNQLPIVFSYFHFRLLDYFKFGFFITFKAMGKSLLALLVWVGSGLLFYFLTPAWFFVGISLSLFLIHQIFRPTYWYLVHNQEDLKTMDQYDLKEDQDEISH